MKLRAAFAAAAAPPTVSRTIAMDEVRTTAPTMTRATITVVVAVTTALVTMRVTATAAVEKAVRLVAATPAGTVPTTTIPGMEVRGTVAVVTLDDPVARTKAPSRPVGD